MKKFIAAVAAAAVVVGGGVITSAVSAPAVAQAQEADTTTESTTEVPEFTSVLDELVAEGVITQDQADTVSERLAERGYGRFGRFGHTGRGMHIDTLADVIGVDAETIKAALMDGQTIADIAADNGVERQAVVDALTAQAEESLAEAVADGRITQEEADEKLAEAATRIEGLVDGEVEFRGRGHGRHGRNGNVDNTTEDAEAVESSFSA
ncbi:MAG: hypothetical protein HKN07_07635 [Acidimicrobiia bacterium]|nr:hypothetical protein [Acidimicrobiia bacterium]